METVTGFICLCPFATVYFLQWQSHRKQSTFLAFGNRFLTKVSHWICQLVTAQRENGTREANQSTVVSYCSWNWPTCERETEKASVGTLIQTKRNKNGGRSFLSSCKCFKNRQQICSLFWYETFLLSVWVNFTYSHICFHYYPHWRTENTKCACTQSTILLLCWQTLRHTVANRWALVRWPWKQQAIHLEKRESPPSPVELWAWQTCCLPGSREQPLIFSKRVNKIWQLGFFVHKCNQQTTQNQ